MFYRNGRPVPSIDLKKCLHGDKESLPTRISGNITDDLYRYGVRHERCMKILDQRSRKH